MYGKQGIPQYTSVWNCMTKTFKYEGIKGFYRGIQANFCRQMTYSTLRCWIYEDLKRMSRVIRNKIFT